MSEFQEIMRQWKRMCKFYRHCMDCPLCNLNCSEGFNDWVDFDEKQIQDVVETWVKNHPEPLYPTWAEWLYSQGIVYSVTSDAYDEHLSTYRKMAISERNIFKPMPADIAEKLGIEPKGEWIKTGEIK